MFPNVPLVVHPPLNPLLIIALIIITIITHWQPIQDQTPPQPFSIQVPFSS